MQTGDDTEALRAVRKVLARDPNFLDMRAAETAFLWAEGDSVQAEESYSRSYQILVFFTDLLEESLHDYFCINNFFSSLRLY